jgi:hypothetical protein
VRAKFFSSSASNSGDKLVGFDAEAKMGLADEEDAVPVLGLLSRRHEK